MILWLDAQISPKLCSWIHREFDLDTVHVRDLALREAADREIFDQARVAGAVVLTKDEDFVELLRRLGPPPHVIWLSCGNAPNSRLKVILAGALPEAIEMLRRGESLVEITEGPGAKRARRTDRPRRERRKLRT